MEANKITSVSSFFHSTQRPTAYPMVPMVMNPSNGRLNNSLGLVTPYSYLCDHHYGRLMVDNHFKNPPFEIGVQCPFTIPHQNAHLDKFSQRNFNRVRIHHNCIHRAPPSLLNKSSDVVLSGFHIIMYRRIPRISSLQQMSMSHFYTRASI